MRGLLKIRKKHLTEKEQDYLRKDLTLINPEYQNKRRFSRFKSKDETGKYDLFYEEHEKYFLIPRNYYEDIQIERKQVPICNQITLKSDFQLRRYQRHFLHKNAGLDHDCVWNLPCGHGKCLGKGTKVLMYDGSLKVVEDIVVGDLLMGDDSTPRKVLSTTTGREMMYWVHQNRAESYRVNESHIISLKRRNTMYDMAIIDIPIKQYITKSKNFKNINLGYRVPVEFDFKDITVDPYFLGAWLGDGHSSASTMTTDVKDKVLIAYWYEIAAKYNLFVTETYQKDNASKTFAITGKHIVPNILLQELRELRVINNKHIPFNYKTNTREIRLQVLAGLIDTDGSYSNKCLEITQRRKKLILDIQQMCWSLGFRTNLKPKIIKGVTYWRMTISGNIADIPTKLHRKLIGKRTIFKDPFVNKITVVKDKIDKYYGFEIDGNRRFLLQDSTVTHNTVLAVWKGVKMQTKFLVVVPTHFLERQWKKRIKAMTDGAFIHCISTKKDIPYNSNNVFIVTIETLKLLDYKKRQELSEHIGIVFFDEAHRMGANTYHPVLNDLEVPYFQALTATFRRGDGRERILTYHFGEIYRMKNKLPKAIVQPYYTGIDCERVVKYKSVPDFFRKDIEKMKDDDLFNVPEYLYNKWNKYVGKNRSEKMRLSNFKKLLDRPMIGNVDTFISRHFRKQTQIKKLITACLENGRKPLILGKRLQALKVLHKHFLKLGYKSVLVIGNTKVKDDDEQDKLLQEAELIFGIDALAKEGLDVDNVDTLLTLRAMPDPEQPIGRIQRLHPDKKYPLVLYPIDGSNYYKYMFTGSKKYMIENSVVREPVKFLKALKMVEDGSEFTSITSS